MALTPSVALHRQAREQHRRNDGHGVGLEKISGHAGTVADVVTHVVGDYGGVARVVFRNAGFDLAHEVRADVRALGENAAAESREDRDQRTTKGEADERMERGFLVAARDAEHHPVISRDPDQAESDDEHAGDGATAERHLQGGVEADTGRLRGAHVGTHRDVHADVAGKTREHGAHGKAAGRSPSEREAEHEE